MLLERTRSSTTIMLNWIVIWVGTYLFGYDGPLQGMTPPRTFRVQPDRRRREDLGPGSGAIRMQGPWISLGVAFVSLVVYALILNRTTLGYEVRAVGHSPEAARYGGISVARNYVLAMGIAGSFAGLAGALDVLGWKFKLDTTDFTSTIGFIGIAVALLGRNKAVGIGLAALLFAALQTGTSTRNLDPEIFLPSSRPRSRSSSRGSSSCSSGPTSSSSSCCASCAASGRRLSHEAARG